MLGIHESLFPSPNGMGMLCAEDRSANKRVRSQAINMQSIADFCISLGLNRHIETGDIFTG